MAETLLVIETVEISISLQLDKASVETMLN